MFTALTILLSLLCSAEEEPVRYLPYHGSVEFVPNLARDREWFYLSQEEDGHVLTKCKIDVKQTSVYSELAGQEVPGSVITITGGSKSGFAVCDPGSFREGKVLVSFDGSIQFRQPVVLFLESPSGGEEIGLYDDGDAREIRVRHGFQTGHKTYVLFRDEKHGGRSGTPKMYWAGDLDRDGKLDYLMHLPQSIEDYVTISLFLSSQFGEDLHPEPYTVWSYGAGC